MPKTWRRAFFQENNPSQAAQGVLEQSKKVFGVDCNFVTQAYITYETNYDSKNLKSESLKSESLKSESLKSESLKSESLKSESLKIRKQDYDFFQSNTDYRGSNFFPQNFLWLVFTLSWKYPTATFLVSKVGTNETPDLHCMRMRCSTLRNFTRNVQTKSHVWHLDH